MALSTGKPEWAFKDKPAGTSQDGFGDRSFGKANCDFALIAIRVAHHKAMLGAGPRTLFVDIATADNGKIIFRL